MSREMKSAPQQDLSIAEMEALIAWHKKRIADLERARGVLLVHLQTVCEHEYVEVDVSGPRDNGERHYKCRMCNAVR